MNITEHKKGGIVILSLNGRLDSNTSAELESKILGIIDDGEKRIIVDCLNLDYISSRGLRVFLLGAKKLKNVGGEVVLTSLKDQIKEVFDCTGFTSIFKIFNSNEEAINTFK